MFKWLYIFKGRSWFDCEAYDTDQSIAAIYGSILSIDWSINPWICFFPVSQSEEVFHYGSLTKMKHEPVAMNAGDHCRGRSVFGTQRRCNVFLVRRKKKRELFNFLTYNDQFCTKFLRLLSITSFNKIRSISNKKKLSCMLDKNNIIKKILIEK